MPIPQPNKDTETRSDFIKRCFNDKVMLSEYPKDTQRYAICVTQWNEKNEATTTAGVAQANPTRIGMFLRNKPVSAGILQEDDFTDLLDFVVNLDFEVWKSIEDLEFLDKLMGDVEYLGRTSTLNEGIYRAHKSDSQKRAYARKWYVRNRGKLAAKRRKLKTNINATAREKKKERLSKQRKNAKGKPLKKYPSTKNHINEERKLKSSFKDYLI